MAGLKSNLLANFAGLGLPTLLQLVLVPVYIRLMGIESYGLIGFYVMLLTIMQVLDLGLGTTMNREMARYSTQPDNGQEARDFVRTLELLYWSLGIVGGGIVVAMAPLIATRWINPGTLPIPVVKTSVAIMGGLVAVQFPITLYQGGLLGLQRQVLLNSVRVVGAFIGNGGAALILWLVSPTITAFLLLATDREFDPGPRSRRVPLAQPPFRRSSAAVFLQTASQHQAVRGGDQRHHGFRIDSHPDGQGHPEQDALSGNVRLLLLGGGGGKRLVDPRHAGVQHGFSPPHVPCGQGG